MNPSMQKTAAILGASGLVGGYCLKALLAAPEWNTVIVFTRRDLALPRQAKMEQKIVDLNRLTAADFAGVNQVFCATGTTIRKAGSPEEFRRVDYEMPLAAARAAGEAGARQFAIVSAAGADPESRNFYLRTKGELDRDLEKLGFPALHILRPGLLLGHRQEYRPLERMATRFAPLMNLTLWGPLKRYRSISARQVAQAMVGAVRTNKSGINIYEYDEILEMANPFPTM
jgi:uncharacterized protein YbjT (DUF2867 family)